MFEEVKIEKLVHGGQGLGQLLDGKKIFVWNALPGEVIKVRVTKKRRDYAEGIAEEILKQSEERIDPVDDAYLSTSPWQIMTTNAENNYKKQILSEAFQREGVDLPEYDFISNDDTLHYRNKMEYSFWGDDDGLHLALFNRGSHGKRIIKGSSIARPEIDESANKILAILNKNGVRASSLKTLVLRSSKNGEVVAALFVKDEKFNHFDFGGLCKGIAVYYSNPKSPASVVTEKLYEIGDIVLDDNIQGTQIKYDVNSFFQVNLPIFETTLAQIKTFLKNETNIVDMYAGTGTIGLCVGASKLVEVDEKNVAMAKLNSQGHNIEVIHESTENALNHISSQSTLIIDPPRAGLHTKVINHLLEALPNKIIYLSCNPSTQARDVAMLKSQYHIQTMTGYNFFPRTPHIESLVLLIKYV